MASNTDQASHPTYKNLAASLLFSAFLGPLGLLYATSLGGIIMLVVAFVVISCGFPVPIILMWISCSVWSVLATNRHNHQLLKIRTRETSHEEENHSPAASR